MSGGIFGPFGILGECTTSVQKWGLFVRISSTSIYMGKLGPEEVWKREKMIEKVSTLKELGEKAREREREREKDM